MKTDQDKHKIELIEELQQLRARVSQLEDEVSAQKEGTQSLQKSETLLKNIFQAIPDLLSVHDKDLRVVLSNWHGHEYITEAERAGQPYCYAVYFHRDTPCDSCHIKEVFESREAKYLEMENPVDGIVREINVYPVFDADGNVELVAEHVRDITERKQAERVQRQFSALVEHAPFGVAHIERLGRIKYLNPRLTQILGYTLDDLPTIETWFEKLYPDPGHRAVAKQAWQKATSDDKGVGNEISPVFRLTAKDGTEKMIQFRLVQLESEEFLLTLEDITAGLQTKNDLEESKERFQRLFEAEQQKLTHLSVVNRVARNAVSILDTQQLLQTSVLAIKKGFGYYNVIIMLLDEATNRLGKQVVAGQYSALAASEYTQSIDEGLIGWAAKSGESVVVNDTRKDPRYILGFKELADTQSEMCVPLKSADRVLGVLDVQEIYLNAFDESDLMAMETLADQIAVALENARLYKQARQDAEAKVVLLREVNHRVNNNLAAIIGLVGIEQSREVINQATYQTAMDDLNRRICGLATVHRLLSSTEWSPIPLSELTTNVINSALQGLLPTKKVVATVTPSTVEVSPGAANNLALIINELATNAIKHAWPNRRMGHLAVSIEEDSQDDMIGLEFRDDGVGFPREVLDMKSHNLGWELLETLINRGLQGDFSLHNEQGAVVTIHFSVSQ